MSKSVRIIAESILFAIVAIFVGSVVSSFVLRIFDLDSTSQSALANMILDVALLVSQLIVLVIHYKKDSYKMTGLVSEGKVSVIILLLCLVIAGLVVGFSFAVLHNRNIIEYIGTGFLFYENKKVFCFIFILFIQMLLVAITEEILFRGVIARHLANISGNLVTVLVSTIIFTIFHCMVIQSFTQMTDIFFLGLILGILYIKSGHILYSIAFHFGIDFVTNLVGIRGQSALFLIDSNKGENYITSQLFGVMSLFGFLIVLVYFIYSLVSKKNND